MLVAAAIVAGFALILNFVLLGGVIGYLAYGYLAAQVSQLPQHPEFYDENGNIIADEILAIRIEHGLDDEWEEENE